MAIAPGATLADHIVPAGKTRTTQLLRDTLLVLGFAALISSTARLEIHLSSTAVPITLQTLFVLLTGAALGSRRGALAMLAYLAAGAAGLPVFAGGTSTIELIGVTAGYLWSFPIAAFVVGPLCERRLDRSFWTSIVAMLPGSVIIYTIGASWLAVIAHMNPSQAFVEGVLPFIPGDLIKLVIAVLLLPCAWMIVRAIKRDYL